MITNLLWADCLKIGFETCFKVHIGRVDYLDINFILFANRTLLLLNRSDGRVV